ncbi:hypothetical protein F4819DRAFT_36845 [Hypoxylon fuscum]|nr:hypothetical protein F4819DRAFT_36845 [Hypoxylon fuscum]
MMLMFGGLLLVKTASVLPRIGTELSNLCYFLVLKHVHLIQGPRWLLFINFLSDMDISTSLDRIYPKSDSKKVLREPFYRGARCKSSLEKTMFRRSWANSQNDANLAALWSRDQSA